MHPIQQMLNVAVERHQAGNPDEAERLYRQILAMDPDHVDALHLLGVLLHQKGRNDLAVDYLRQAVRFGPNFASAHSNLGTVLWLLGQLDEALTSYREALRLKPDFTGAHSNLIAVLHYHPDCDAAAFLAECRRWDQLHAAPLRKFILPHDNPPDPQRKLRIGYVSPDFRDHVDAHFSLPLLSNHDRDQFEIFCYADAARPDPVGTRLRGHADAWRSTVGMSDQQMAEMIRGDRIDILVDLKLHASRNRLLVFARKPAPVQACWLGYPGTTGLSAMDYRLTDPYLDPPGLLDAFYAEQSIRLPDTFWCYEPLVAPVPINALPALTNGFITFGCLNNFCKVNDGCLSLWAKVLQAVPGSRLLMLAPMGPARERVLARFAQEGVAAGRVEFTDRLPRLEYLQLFHRIDACLDPFPYNGHTTSLDAFWMGVPTITLIGKTVVGRAGWSQLCNLGLKDLAAQTPEQYVSIAARLAGDLAALQELRGTLRQRLADAPLMDGKRFARHMEQAFRHMWHQWCSSR